jgi:hypothetical protein
MKGGDKMKDQLVEILIDLSEEVITVDMALGQIMELLGEVK